MKKIPIGWRRGQHKGAAQWAIHSMQRVTRDGELAAEVRAQAAKVQREAQRLKELLEQK